MVRFVRERRRKNKWEKLSIWRRRWPSWSKTTLLMQWLWNQISNSLPTLPCLLRIKLITIATLTSESKKIQKFQMRAKKNKSMNLSPRWSRRSSKLKMWLKLPRKRVMLLRSDNRYLNHRLSDNLISFRNWAKETIFLFVYSPLKIK